MVNFSLTASGNTGNQPTYYFGVFADFLRQSSVIFRPEIKDGNTVYPGLTPLSASVKWLNGKSSPPPDKSV